MESNVTLSLHNAAHATQGAHYRCRKSSSLCSRHSEWHSSLRHHSSSKCIIDIVDAHARIHALLPRFSEKLNHVDNTLLHRTYFFLFDHNHHHHYAFCECTVSTDNTQRHDITIETPCVCKNRSNIYLLDCQLLFEKSNFYRFSIFDCITLSVNISASRFNVQQNLN